LVIIREIRYFDATKNRISRPTHERRRLLRAAATEATAAAAREIRYTRRASFPKVSTRFRSRSPPTTHTAYLQRPRKGQAHRWCKRFSKNGCSNVHIIYTSAAAGRILVVKRYKSELYYTTNIILLLLLLL